MNERIARILVVYNPMAGRRRITRLRRFVQGLRAGGAEVTVAATDHAGHGRILSRDAGPDGAFTHVVAAGGDGTISEVADGLLEAMRPSFPSASASMPGPVMGVLPLGTANVLAHELGVAFAPGDNARALLSGRWRTIWPGRIEAGGQARIFVQMASAGFDAQVVTHLSLRAKRVLGRGAYAVQAIREAGRYDFPPLQVVLDGQAHTAFGIVCSKGRFYGGRHVLAPEATPLERGFSVTLLDEPGAGPIARVALGLLCDRPDRVRGLRRVRASHIALTAPDGLALQHDGDPSGGSVPCIITDAAHPLRIAV